MELLAYIRANWRLLLGIEVIMLVMFLMFVQIRMSNPDLWHNGYGGEKPMDFAYFNGVLRSTIFPPIDPWYAGGYLNYYYFGFVIAGVPTLFTGIAPYIAYNLLIPTWFSLTGIAAFSVAFSLVSSWKTSQVDRRADGWTDDQTPQDTPPRTIKTLGNPWIAGIAALLMAVVLGNLGTAQVVTESVASLGGWQEPSGLSNYLYTEAVENYKETNGLPPDEVTTYQLQQLANERANSGRLDDRLEYEFNNVSTLISGLINGTGKVLQGQEPYIAPNHWFWSPTRTIAEILGKRQSDGAINEMPFFTFLYGDLHAHMLAMPMTIFVLAFVFHEVLVAGDDKRRGLARFVALFLGALTVGMFQATNTWDLPTYMILSVLGLGYAWWLSWRTITRWSLMSLAWRVGGFVVIAFGVALPFSMWFASGITEFMVWKGDKTPLWAYFTIHGLFLFVIVSWLTWETSRWLRSAKVAALRGRAREMLLGIFFLGIALFISIVLAVIEYQVALVVIPLVAWIVVLFFRPGQSRAMQFALVITAMALCITLGTEIITLRFDNGRQNTIFKFYIQVWLIFSIVAGAGFAWIVKNSAQWRARIAIPWYLFGMILFFVAAMYPITATRGRQVFRFSQDVPRTLNGLAYMNYTTHYESVQCPTVTVMSCNDYERIGGTIDLSNDYNVIRWLQENVEGTPTIMEAISLNITYQWGARISVNTGLPSVVGWSYHQTQQRSLEPLNRLVDQRVANVNAFYTTTDIPTAAHLLQYYDVRYIIVSDYELRRYVPVDGTQPSGIDKFAEMVDLGLLRVAYHEGDATIYEVLPEQLEAYYVANLLERGG